MTPLCGWCEQPIRGLASIGDIAYCHPDAVSGPSCYEQATWDLGRRQRAWTLIEALEALEDEDPKVRAAADSYRNAVQQINHNQESDTP